MLDAVDEERGSVTSEILTVPFNFVTEPYVACLFHLQVSKATGLTSEQ